MPHGRRTALYLTAHAATRSAAAQELTFHVAKGKLSQRKRQPFAAQKITFHIAITHARFAYCSLYSTVPNYNRKAKQDILLTVFRPLIHGCAAARRTDAHVTKHSIFSAATFFLTLFYILLNNLLPLHKNTRNTLMNKISDLTHVHVKLKKQWFKDMFFICLGILSYAFGFTAFVLPEEVVMGGASGISALLYYAFKFPPGISIWVLNITMLLIAMKALSRQFTIRTIIGVSILGVFVGVLQPIFQAFPVITAGEDKFMHVLIGGTLCGAGLGLVYSHNGSTGGTDIIIALLNKFFRMSFGRAMQLVDTCIICSSYFLFHSAETIVYGIAFTITTSYVCDYVVNGSRQTMQFIIISKEYEKIADIINNKIHRGVTVIPGKGWYSKHEVDILIVLARKYESHDVLNTIKIIDPEAMVSQTLCHGVFGEGFDKMK